MPPGPKEQRKADAGKTYAPPSPSKRKQRRTKYFPRVSEEVDAPPFGMMASIRTLDTADVEAHLTSTIERFSKMLCLDVDLTRHFLIRCLWKKTIFLEAYLDDYTTLLYETGLAPQGARNPSPPAAPLDPSGSTSCPVCLETKPNPYFCSLWCGHWCCRVCWSSHIKVRDNFLDISCTVSECHASPTKDFLIREFGADSETVKMVSVMFMSVWVC